jgi:hypothetical protein
VSENNNKLWRPGPPVRNAAKMIAAAGAENALAKHCQGEHIAGFVIILAYTDGMVEVQGAHLSEEDIKRSVTAAAFICGASHIKGANELDGT